ncbi:hypothetical protein [Nitrosomonas communis]|uniref:hypothetical protein n=1 Tax=Nitrosomonas communis TaxID=44574 RepID=UPI0026EEA936|nr:hypothetical protein [Nitrosomonas communis]MCO6426987.1 hypothetical protein [Nitrosomonas communis]
METVSESSAEDFNARMAKLTTGYVKRTQSGKFNLYIEVCGQRLWHSQHDSFAAASAMASAHGCGQCHLTDSSGRIMA